MVDNRETILEIGQEVAYNISGGIAKGKIVHMKRGRIWAHGNMRNEYVAPIKIELLHKAAGKEKGHISTIKRPSSLMVLLDKEN